VWLDGELLVPGPTAFAPVLVWERPWPGGFDASQDPSGRILVVPGIRDADSEEQAAGTHPRYAALITDTSPAPWKGREPSGPVLRFDRDLFRTGDPARVEGDTSRVELPEVEEVPVVTAFLEGPDGRILLLRRSSRVGSFQGRWAGVSGYLESESAEAQAYTEIQEETGLTPAVLHLERTGRVVYARDGQRVFSVRPFRFRVTTLDVRLDWEHTEAEWVDPAEIGRREVVPKLDRAWAAVRPEGNR